MRASCARAARAARAGTDGRTRTDDLETKKGVGMHTLVAMAALLNTQVLPPTYPTIPMSGIAGPMEMPMVGLGTWEYNTSVAFDAVNTAFAAGYRHVDTALGCTPTL